MRFELIILTFLDFFLLFNQIDSNLDEENQDLLSRLLAISFSDTQVISVSHLPLTRALADCVISLDRMKTTSIAGNSAKPIERDSTFVVNVTYKNPGH